MNIPSDRDFIVPLHQEGDDLYAVFPYDRPRVNPGGCSFNTDGELTLNIDLEETISIPISVVGGVREEEIDMVHCLDYSDVQAEQTTMEDLSDHPDAMDPVPVRPDRALRLDESSGSMPGLEELSDERGSVSVQSLLAFGGAGAAGVGVGFVSSEALEYMNMLDASLRPYVQHGVSGVTAMMGLAGQSLWSAVKEGTRESDLSDHWSDIQDAVKNTTKTVVDQIPIEQPKEWVRKGMNWIGSCFRPVNHPDDPSDAGVHWQPRAAAYAQALKEHLSCDMNESIGVHNFCNGYGVNINKHPPEGPGIHHISPALPNAVDPEKLKDHTITLREVYEQARELGRSNKIRPNDLALSMYRSVREAWINHPDGSRQDFAGSAMSFNTPDENFLRERSFQDGSIDYDLDALGLNADQSTINHVDSIVDPSISNSP